VVRDSKGFTLIELMIVVVILGVLAAIAIPNFISMQDRAREASVKANMHTVQLAIEDFATKSQGIYPLAAAAAAVKTTMPQGLWPTNPFTGVADESPLWDADPAAMGRYGVNPATVAGYTIKGYGRSTLLSLQLING